MQCGTFFRANNVVADIHGDGITPVGFDRWTRERSVNEEGAFVHSIWSNGTSGDVEVVRGASACEKGQHESDVVRQDGTYRK